MFETKLNGTPIFGASAKDFRALAQAVRDGALEDVGAAQEVLAVVHGRLASWASHPAAETEIAEALFRVITDLARVAGWGGH